MSPLAGRYRSDMNTKPEVQTVQVSVDPSIVKTGVCIWSQGKVIRVATLRTGKGTDIDRALRLKIMFQNLLAEYCSDNSQVTTVAIEEFMKHRKNPMLDMMRCSMAQGVLVATADEWCDDVRLVSKGTAPKSEAALLAHAANIKGSADAIDAFHLGIVAGFDRWNQST